MFVDGTCTATSADALAAPRFSPHKSAVATPKDFGRFLFTKHWLAIEIASLLLLVALIGALHIGRERPETKEGAP